jgi:carbon monoxide dehydrogenase subunit G
MNTTITKSFHVENSIEDVWANLTNPEKVVVCVPGASLTEKVDDNNYKGDVELKFGPVKASYGGLITFTERDPVAHKMTLKGTGTDSKGKGNADDRKPGPKRYRYRREYFHGSEHHWHAGSVWQQANQ